MCVYIYVSYTNTDIYRKDTFPKGILRENVNRLYLAVLPTWYKQGLEKCGGLGTPGEGRSGVTCEMERRPHGWAPRVSAALEGSGCFFQGAENKPGKSLAETEWETASQSHGTRLGQWKQCGSWWQVSSKDSDSEGPHLLG